MIRSTCVLSLALLAGRDSVVAFAPSPLSVSASAAYTSWGRLTNSNDLCALNNNDNESTTSLETSRRDALQTLSLAFASSIAALSSNPQNADAASSEIFKPNPLTNSVLENIRIWNQDEVDNIKYGGELESGSAKPAAFDQYVALLQPILTVENDLSTIDQLLKNEKPSTKEEYITLFKKIESILSKELFDKINFKKAFNAFADNIYYSDPDRANLYLGGGAVPQTSQSIAYLVRNDVLTSIEDMRAEVQYLLKELGKAGDGETIVVGGNEGGLDLEEIVGLSKIANGGMVKYLDLVPPKELEAARAKFAAQ